MMNKVIHNLVQGTNEWAEHRSSHFNASEAPVVLGVSKYQSRSELLHEKATGISKEVNAATQAIFDDGHRFESAARPLAEKIIGEELFAPTASVEIDGLRLSASFDGVTMMEDVIWEHKTKNQKLSESLSSGVIPDEYKPQLEQQLLIMGAEKCLFMASNGDHETAVYAWYESDPDLRVRLIAAWKQFAADLAAYVPTAPVVEVIGRAPDELPALHIEVTGMVTASNLDAFKSNAIAVIQGINRELSTDTDFANAEKTVKWLGGVEDKLKAAKEHALAQTQSIDALFKAIDSIGAEARTTRLELEKLVKARKDGIRIEIQQAAQQALFDHMAGLNKRLGGRVTMPAYTADFASAMKGKKTVASLKDACDTLLAQAKIDTSAAADKIEINLNSLRELAKDHAFLFNDAQQLVMKANEDLVLLINARISEHEAKEAARLEAERERIRKEEADKLERERLRAEAVEREARLQEDARKRQAEADAIKGAQPAEADPVVQPAAAPAKSKPAGKRAQQQPTAEQLVNTIARAYLVTTAEAAQWLVTMDMAAIADMAEGVTA